MHISEHFFSAFPSRFTCKKNKLSFAITTFAHVRTSILRLSISDFFLTLAYDFIYLFNRSNTQFALKVKPVVIISLLLSGKGLFISDQCAFSDLSFKSSFSIWTICFLLERLADFYARSLFVFSVWFHQHDHHLHLARLWLHISAPTILLIALYANPSTLVAPPLHSDLFFFVYDFSKSQWLIRTHTRKFGRISFFNTGRLRF